MNIQKEGLPKLLPGLIVILVIGAISKFLGGIFPLVGSVILALILGIIMRNVGFVKDSWEPGISFTLKRILKLAIIFLGANLSFQQVVKIGSQSILIIFVSVIIGIFLTLWVGRLINIHQELSLLIGVGTSICGATAIAVVKGALNPKEEHTAYAISVIFFFNLIATFLYPVIGGVLHLTPLEFGVWAGTAVHDTSSSVAVGYMYGDESGEVATTVKLVRTLFIIPIVIVIGYMMNRKDSSQSIKGTIKNSFPQFILWFLALSFLNSLGVFSEEVSSLMNSLAKFMIIMVMASVGFQVKIKQFFSLGTKPLIVGLISSVFISSVSLLLIKILF